MEQSFMLFFVLSFIVLLMPLIGTTIAIVQRNEQIKFTKEVNLEEVPVKGRKFFHAEIEIVCQDGRIKSANLLTGTTKVFVDKIERRIRELERETS